MSPTSQKEVNQLVKKGVHDGYLTTSEIFVILPPDLVEELDDLLAQLRRLQVAIVETPEEGAQLARERRRQEASELSANDALSSYLREMTELPSMDREAEIHSANEYHAGITLALGAVAQTRFFVEQVLLRVSAVRRGLLSLWDLVDRARYAPQDAPSPSEEDLLNVISRISQIHQEERRILSQLQRRGLSTEKAKALSRRLKETRGRLSVLLLQIPFEQSFLKEIAGEMLVLHRRLELLEEERVRLAAELNVDPAELSRTLRRRRVDPKEEELERIKDMDRRLRNLKRKIRRQEIQAGLSYDALRSVVSRYRLGILRAQRARDSMILGAQRLVLSSARYYGRRLGGSGMEVADLISAGNLGLIRAVELFDPSRGNRFSTFAGHWVRHAMIRTIHTQSRTVYIPPHIRQQMSKILAVENELIQRLGRSPTDEELARKSEIDVPRLRHTVQSFGRMSSIDRPLDPADSGSGTYGDILADDKETPHEALEGAERREMVRRLAEELEGREREIVFLRMGWNNEEPWTLAEIGEQLGVSRQRVEQLEKRALAKLRRWALSRGLGDPFNR